MVEIFPKGATVSFNLHLLRLFQWKENYYFGSNVIYYTCRLVWNFGLIIIIIYFLFIGLIILVPIDWWFLDSFFFFFFLRNGGFSTWLDHFWLKTLQNYSIPINARPAPPPKKTTSAIKKGYMMLVGPFTELITLGVGCLDFIICLVTLVTI